MLVNCAGTGNAFKTASRDKKTGAIQHVPIDQFERINTIPRGIFDTPRLGALPDDVKASLAASIRFPSASPARRNTRRSRSR